MAEKDIISKAVFKQIAVDLANIFFGFKITVQDELQILETEHQQIQDRQADLVLKVKPQAKAAYILHIEIQNNYHSKMAHRMLSYYLDISYAHPKIPIYQYVIYIGKAPLSMPNQLQQDKLNYQYNVLDIRTIKCEELIMQGTPDALVLAILCNFGEKKPQTVVNLIVKGLSDYCAENESEYRRYIMMLEILADNRDLKQHIKEAEQMITQVQVENLPSYEIGLEKGIERGIKKGIERGVELAKIKREHEKIQSAQKLLAVLDDEMIATSLNLSLEKVQRIRAEYKSV